MKTTFATLTCVLLALSAFAAPPSNDSFATPITIPSNGGSTTVSNIEATSQNGEPLHLRNGGAASGGHSVWFRWAAPADGKIVVDTIGSSFDTILALYSPITGNTLNKISGSMYSDDDGGNGTSKLIVPVIGGLEYYFAVDGFSPAQTGTVQFKVAYTAGTPVHDAFANPTILAGTNGQLLATSVGATTDAGDLDDNLNGASVWFQWVAPVSGQVTFTAPPLTGEPATTVIVYSGSSLNTLTALTNATSEASCHVTAGTTYRIRVAGQVFSFSGGSDFLLNYRTNTDRGTFSFTYPSYTVREDGETAHVNVRRTGGTSSEASVNYRLTASTASKDVDFNSTGGVLQFAAGQTHASIAIPVTDDAEFELRESFHVQLFNPSLGASVEGISSALVEISDNDLTSVAAGRYFGRSMATASSLVDLTVSAKGAVSGKLRFQNGTYPFKTLLDGRGEFLAIVPRKNLAPLKIAGRFTPAGGFSYSIFDFNPEPVSAGGLGRPLAFSKAAPYGGAGVYHAVADGGMADGLPHGTSFLKATISPLGKVKIVGTLADGTSFSASTVLNKVTAPSSPELTFLAPLYGGKGALFASLSVDEATGQTVFLAGAWDRPASSKGRFKAGFHLPAFFSGSRYVAPTAPLRVLSGLDASNGLAQFELLDANQNTLLVKNVTFSTAHLVTPALPNPEKLAVKVNARTGLVTGSFLADTNVTLKFKGICVQDGTGFITGFTLTPDTSLGIVINP